MDQVILQQHFRREGYLVHLHILSVSRPYIGSIVKFVDIIQLKCTTLQGEADTLET